MGAKLERPLESPRGFFSCDSSRYNRRLNEIFETIEGNLEEKLKVVRDIVEKNENLQDFIYDHGLYKYLDSPEKFDSLSFDNFFEYLDEAVAEKLYRELQKVL